MNLILIQYSVFSILNYLPTELISQSLFNFVHMDDTQMLKTCFQEAISNSPAKIQTNEYRFRMGNSKNYSIIQSVLFALKNPFSNNFQYILLQNKFCSMSLIPQHQLQQQQQQPKKKTIQTTSSSNLAMPMTPSPEDDESYNSNNNNKYTLSILTKKLNNNNDNFKFKHKSNTSQHNFDNNNNNLQTYLPNNDHDNSQVRLNDTKDSYFNISNSLLNEQFTYDFTENLNDFLLSKNHQSINQQLTGTDEKRQNSYNLMINNNSIQENTEMLMEILKNEKDCFPVSLHSNLNNNQLT